MTSRILFAALIACGLAAPGFAAEIEVHMLNKGAAGTMVFEPDYVRAEPGDVIRFIPTDKSHNVEAIKDMLPPGAAVFKGKINEELDVTVTEPGIYGVKCTPHLAMGMVMVIQVGAAPADLADEIEKLKAVKLPKKARERMDLALDQVQ
ncbi:pseudoazurin [Pseudomonas sp. GX19020]|uniref:pseudoazurin n=1 Tax=Pseudomonadota TaxID=1224 RepID=UPI000897E1CA|nr:MULTISPECIES: pseudoazurin [Pseudomonadota]MCL4068469.1 pseudoazurin [Pseudomonas sp. GX19020]SEB43471.1 pseudoazurin [Rhodobacter sp. 24-YEA-8]